MTTARIAYQPVTCLCCAPLSSRYLFTEWEDPTFGHRASTIHAAFVTALHTSPGGDRTWQAIRRQTDMVSQLAYVSKEIKMGRMRAARATEKLREMVRRTASSMGSAMISDNGYHMFICSQGAGMLVVVV